MHPKFDPKVFQLGYVALETADLPRSRDHYKQTIGMTETAKGDDGSVFLSVGYNHHDIVLRPAKQKALVHLGFQLKPHIALADFERDVRELGLPAMVKSDSQPGIAELVEVTAPGGNVFQFYSAAEAPAPGFAKGGVAPLRLGHVAVISPEGDKLRKFYQEFLGFWPTDDIAGIAHFLTCNREHHVVNIMTIPELRVHHIAFQLKDNSHMPPLQTRCGRPASSWRGVLRGILLAQSGWLSLRPRQAPDRALYRDGHLHPRIGDVRGASVA